MQHVSLYYHLTAIVKNLIMYQDSNYTEMSQVNYRIARLNLDGRDYTAGLGGTQKPTK